MFLLGGLGALLVWYLRKSLPESPRWLESAGHTEAAERLLQSIEREVSAQHGPLPPPAAAPPAAQHIGIAALLNPTLLPRMIVGSVTLIVANTLIYGFVTWLPTFFVHQGLAIATSFKYSLVMSIGAPIGSLIAALCADSWGRKPTIIGASLATILVGSIYPFVSLPSLLMAIGCLLIVPIYVLITTLFAIYIPELFPTEVRMRAAGICNTFGRGATILTPFLVVALFRTYGVRGVLALMIALLIVQIFVVLAFGIEPRKRRLEDLDLAASRDA